MYYTIKYYKLYNLIVLVNVKAMLHPNISLIMILSSVTKVGTSVPAFHQSIQLL